MDRKLIVRTEQGYYEAAMNKNTDGEVYSMAKRLLFMEQALNYTENALAAATEVIKYYAEEAKCYGDDCCFDITDRADNFLKQLK